MLRQGAHAGSAPEVGGEQRRIREASGAEASRAWAARFIAEGLAGLERAMQDGGTGRFSHGDTPGLADCYLVPQLYNARRFDVDLAPYPTLRRVEEACAALAAFQAAHPDRQPDAPPPDRRTP